MFATVRFSGEVGRPALLAPSEALVRTGKRTLVMLALGSGRYQPAEVRTGREANGETEILAGLREGEKVVASGQFLIDSEASLSGINARPIGDPTASAPSASAFYESTGRIEQIAADSMTLSHAPVPALNWPAMTMRFRLADPHLARGFKRGDRVRFAFDQPPEGPTIRRLAQDAGQ